MEGRKLVITHTGLADSLRKIKDGVTYFGGDNPPIPMEVKKANDFEFPKECGLGKNHFKIFYDENVRGYFIQDQGDGTGTFCQIERQLVFVVVAVRIKVIESEIIVSFGLYHLVICLVHSDTSDKNHVKIQLIDDAHISAH
jgi:hypothetical protein